MTKQPIKSVILFSGGLDSTLVIRILQLQGIEVEAINFRTPFGCCQEPTRQIADELGVKVTYLNLNDEYLRVIEKPKYNYGRGVNPCVDCRIHMFQIGKRFMDEIGAKFIASGEVVGQRPNSQRKDCLQNIEKNSELEDLILRPLSARILPPTLPERMGWIDREKLYGFSGRGRKKLIELGQNLGLKTFPTPSAGCLLTDKNYAQRVRDMWKNTLEKNHSLQNYEILKLGRHFRVRDNVKIIVGKNEKDNQRLEKLAQEGMTYLVAENFAGPSVLVTSELTSNALEDIQGIMLFYSRNLPASPQINKFSFGKKESKEQIFSSGFPISTHELQGMRI